MRFTQQQYDEAIANLQLAKQQLEPDARNCVICHDSGHMAFECGHNPLVAMQICKNIAKQSDELHETLHYLAGYNQHMGEQVGPRKVVVPDGTSVPLPRMTAAEANIAVRAHIVKYGNGSTLRSIAAAVGCSTGLVQQTSAWRVLVARRREIKEYHENQS